MTERGIERMQREALRQKLVAEARAAGRRPGDISGAIDAGIVAWRKARIETELAYAEARVAEIKAAAEARAKVAELSPIDGEQE